MFYLLNQLVLMYCNRQSNDIFNIIEVFLSLWTRTDRNHRHLLSPPARRHQMSKSQHFFLPLLQTDQSLRFHQNLTKTRRPLPHFRLQKV